MSEIMLNVRDATREFHTTIHASRVDPLVAALSADPETIEELQAALLRFLPRDEQRRFFDHWRRGLSEESWDAGLAIIDLTGQVVAVQSTYDSVSPRAGVEVIDQSNDERVVVPYHVADTWLFTSEVDSWRYHADKRRNERLKLPPLDARAVLYGKVAEFVAQCCWAIDPVTVTTDEEIYQAIKDIHARWLTTPRDDLRGRAPRDFLLDSRHHIAMDLQDRWQQWSILGSCPPGLGVQTIAYRFGGFGTNEIVLYYDLVRHMVSACWEHRSHRAADHATAPALADEIRRLESVREDWLDTRNFEDLHGRTAASVIERERARLPECTTGAEAVVDDDCPLCQMVADSPAPMLWGLDGCNMDDDFAFSLHAAREEWEEDRRKQEEFNRKFNEEWEATQAQRAASGGNSSDADEADKVWSTGYVDPAVAEFPTFSLFGIGTHLAELYEDLKNTGAPHDIIDQLNRDFGNLREATANPAAVLIDPVVERMRQALTEVAQNHPALERKCTDLDGQLADFASRFADVPFLDEDLPF